jgi:protein-tyrosine phosphatase
MTQILLVCRGNICRSPMAMAVTAQLLQQARLAQPMYISSAGTHAMPRRHGPDPRSSTPISGKPNFPCPLVQ